MSGAHTPEAVCKGVIATIESLAVHDHWPTDISYLWEFGHKSYLLSILEGRSRAVLHHKVLRTSDHWRCGAGTAGILCTSSIRKDVH